MRGSVEGWRAGASRMILLTVLGLVPAGAAWANHEDPKSVERAHARLAPFYDVTPGSGKVSLLVVSTPQPGVSSTAPLANGRMWFYDADCIRRFDLPLRPTPNDVVLVNVAALGTGPPPIGAILLATATDGLTPTGAFPDGTNVTADVFHVDFARNKSFLQGSARNNASVNWTPYDNEAFFPIVIFDDGVAGIVNFYFSCPIADLGRDMNTLDTAVGDAPEPFPTATTAQTLDALVFDLDERALASIHNIPCKCVTITRPSTLFPGLGLRDTHWQFYKVTTGTVGTGYHESEETFTVTGAFNLIDGIVDLIVSDRPYRNPGPVPD